MGNGENRKLQDQLINRQIECEKIKDAYHATRHLVTATNETKEAETDLR